MRDKGFTLIELLFVIAIAGILAAYAVPKYHAVQDVYRLEGAAQRAVSQLQYAKQMAADKRETVYTVFQTDKVGVYMEDDGSLKLTGPALAYEGGVYFHHTLNIWMDEVYEDIDSGDALGWGVRFDYRGFSLDNGTILLKSPSGQTICINISAQTGKIAMDQCEDDEIIEDPDDPDDPGYCDEDEGPLPDYPAWSPSQSYPANNYVIYDNRAFYNRYYANPGQVPGVVGNPWQEITRQWRNFNVYDSNELVCYNGSTFEARYWSHNQQPGLLDSPWQEITSEWRFFNEYQEGDIVLYDGKQFQARNWNKNEQPGLLSSDWQELTDEWRFFNIYQSGDEVLYNGHRYRAKYYSQNAQPDISDAWQLIS